MFNASQHLTSTLLLTSMLVACGDASVATDGASADARYEKRGPHSVGFRELTGVGHQQQALTIKAWYPTHEPDSAVRYGARLQMPDMDDEPVEFLGRASLNAEPDTHAAPFPLVVFSHGFALNPEWYQYLAEHLTSHGLVVLAPQHIESDWFTDALPAVISRPLEVTATIDLAASGALGGIIDSERVAVVGHSMGGYTALAAGGGRLHLKDLARRCEGERDAFSKAYFCDAFLDGEQELAEIFGLQKAPEGLWPDVGDARVDALAVMAGDAYLFGAEGLGEIELPTLLLGGTGDTGTPWDWGAGLAHEHLGSTALWQVALEGAEHLIAVTPCDDMPWITSMPEELQTWFCDDPSWDKQQATRLIGHFTTAFLRSTLLEDPEAARSLSPSLYEDVERLTVR